MNGPVFTILKAIPLKKRKGNRVLAGLLLLCFFIVLSSGCDQRMFIPSPSVQYVHGPSDARQCYHCHEITATELRKFIKAGGEVVGGLPKSGGQIAGLLVLPAKDLCLICHPPKAARSAHWSDKPPVSDGGCTFCHDPHMSPFRFMLHDKFK